MNAEADAIADVIDAVRAVGLTVDSVEAARSDRRADLLAVDVNGRQVVVEIKVGSTPTPEALRRLLDRWDALWAEDTARDPAIVRVYVGDRLVAAARDTLHEHGWSWLDRRGHLHLAGPGLLVDTPVPAAATVPRPRRGNSGGDPLGSRAGLEVACHLLLDPERPASVRGVARALGRSPSTVSAVVSALRAGGLLDADGRPATTDLFWATAEHWRPVTVDVASLPSPGDAAAHDALRTGTDDVDTPGWALTDTLAAQAYGAPVAAPSAYPPDFYVPTAHVADRAVRLLGAAPNHPHRTATIKVAPVQAACEGRQLLASATPSRSAWPHARPLFVALDLAGDPGRGREILDGWTPHEERLRVW